MSLLEPAGADLELEEARRRHRAVERFQTDERFQLAVADIRKAARSSTLDLIVELERILAAERRAGAADQVRLARGLG